jgi:hypothetical protein
MGDNLGPNGLPKGCKVFQCRFEGETLWLTQTQIAELFQVTLFPFDVRASRSTLHLILMRFLRNAKSFERCSRRRGDTPFETPATRAPQAEGTGLPGVTVSEPISPKPHHTPECYAASQSDFRGRGIREVSRRLRHYSLPAILAVGYRMRSHRGTQFRHGRPRAFPDISLKASRWMTSGLKTRSVPAKKRGIAGGRQPGLIFSGPRSARPRPSP